MQSKMRILCEDSDEEKQEDIIQQDWVDLVIIISLHIMLKKLIALKHFIILCFGYTNLR